jgi:hypothetical protein
MIESLALILAAIAVAVAWLVFRLERSATRSREISAARNALLAVRRGMVEGLPDQGVPGWGDIYFRTIYDGTQALRRGLEARKAVEEGKWDQVFVVPTEPLEHLASASSAGPGLISEETIFAANFALWRVHVFNQFVQEQTSFNVQHATEILDTNTTKERRLTLAVTADSISQYLHLDGVGAASAPGGWYDRLKKGLAADIERLDELAALRWWRQERRLRVADTAALLLFAGFLAISIVHWTGRGDADGPKNEASMVAEIIGASGPGEAERRVVLPTKGDVRTLEERRRIGSSWLQQSAETAFFRNANRMSVRQASVVDGD